MGKLITIVQVNACTKIVNAIWFQPNTSISVGEIIKKYGEPGFVSVPHDKLLEISTIQLFLYWDANRISVVLPKIDGETSQRDTGTVYGIEKATEIEVADFSDEELYQDSSEIFGPAYKLWNGYGAYHP